MGLAAIAAPAVIRVAQLMPIKSQLNTEWFDMVMAEFRPITPDMITKETLVLFENNLRAARYVKLTPKPPYFILPAHIH